MRWTALYLHTTKKSHLFFRNNARRAQLFSLHSATNFRATFKLDRHDLTKWAIQALNRGLFGPMNLSKKNKLSTFIFWTAVNVTPAWTWMHFYQVIRNKDVVKMTFTCLFVHVWVVWVLFGGTFEFVHHVFFPVTFILFFSIIYRYFSYY